MDWSPLSLLHVLGEYILMSVSASHLSGLRNVTILQVNNAAFVVLAAITIFAVVMLLKRNWLVLFLLAWYIHCSGAVFTFGKSRLGLLPDCACDRSRDAWRMGNCDRMENEHCDANNRPGRNCAFAAYRAFGKHGSSRASGRTSHAESATWFVEWHRLTSGIPTRRSSLKA